MTVKDYMKLPYTRMITKRDDEDGIKYIGSILELDGCMCVADTVEKVNADLDEVMKDWIEVQLEDGETIPKPVQNSDFSGKFSIRIPSTLHKRLVVEARKEGVSLNQYALYKLSL